VLKTSGGRGLPEPGAGRDGDCAAGRRASLLAFYHFMYEKDSLAGPGTPEQEYDNFARSLDGLYDDGCPLLLDAEQYRDPAWGLPDMTEHFLRFGELVKAGFGCSLGDYMGTYFWRENGSTRSRWCGRALPLAALLAGGEALGAVPRRLRRDHHLAGRRRHDDRAGRDGPRHLLRHVEDFRALGRPATPIVDRYAELRQPYGPLGHTCIRTSTPISRSTSTATRSGRRRSTATG
jgi:hypothetical protein